MAFAAGPGRLVLSRVSLPRHSSITAWGAARDRSSLFACVPHKRVRPLATAAPPQQESGAVPATKAPDAPTPSPISAPASSPTADFAIKLLYDGECPLCVKEVNFLRRRNDRLAPATPIAFVDIADDSYSAADNAGIDYATAMGRIHGITNEGRVLVGVEVFRQVYERLGLGWVYAATKLPGIGAIAEWVYALWADRRLQLTGRPSLEEVIAAREKRTCK